MREFELARPAILAWLLDVMAEALAADAYFAPSSLPRMADFAAWIAVCEPFLGWEPGHFEAIYAANTHESHQITLDSSPIGRHVLEIVSELADGMKWSWTAADFLAILNKAATSQEKKSPEWPRSPKAASEALRRIIPSLREAGVGVTFSRQSGGNRERIISLYALGRKP